MTTWTTETLFNRERFEAWLANQPGDRAFHYFSNDGCAVCSFVRETTSLPNARAGGHYVRPKSDAVECVNFPPWLYEVLFQSRCVKGDLLKDDFTIADLRQGYHKLFNIDVMEVHAPVTLTPQPERV